MPIATSTSSSIQNTKVEHRTHEDVDVAIVGSHPARRELIQLLSCAPTVCAKAVGWDDVDGRDEPGHDGEGRESLLPLHSEGSAGAELATTVASPHHRQIARQMSVQQVRLPAAHPLRNQVLRTVEH